MTTEYNDGLFFRSFVQNNLKGIPGFLKNLDWRNPNAPLIAQSVVNGHLENVFSNVRDIAHDYGLDQATVWCNLLAECDPTDIHWIWSAVAFSKNKGESLLGSRQGAALKRLPVANDEVRCLLMLISDPRGISWQQVALLVPNQKASIFTTFVRNIENERSQTSSSFTRKILSGAMEVFGKDDTERVLTAAARAMSPFDESTGLSTTQLLNLPTNISGEIIRSGSYRKAFLGSATIAELSARGVSARQHKLRKTYPRRDDWARAVASGKLDSPAVIQGLDYWGVDHAALSAAIKKSRSTAPSKKLLEWLKLVPECATINALKILASPRPDRLDLLGGHPEPIRTAIINVIGTEQISEMLLEEGLGDTQIALMVAHQPLASAVVNTHIKQLRASGNQKSTNSLILQYKQFVKRTIHLNELGFFKDSDFPKLKLATSKAVRKSDGELLLALVRPDNIIGLMAASVHARELCTYLVEAVRTQAIKSTYARPLYISLLRKTAFLLLPASANKFLDWEITAILKTRFGKLYLDALGDPSLRKAASGWRNYLDQVDTAGGQLSTKVHRALSANHAWLMETYAGWPKLMDRQAAAELPLSAILPSAFRSRDTGRLVDEERSVQERLKAIDWIREQYSDKPRVAAAYELSLLAGIRFAPYLVGLVKLLPTANSDSKDGRSFDHLYHTYSLPKQSGGSRTITAPNDHLKALQRTLLREGFDAIDVGQYAYGFCKGRSIVDNAQVHAGAKVVVNVDVQSFFPNTRFPLIRQACKTLADGRLSPMAQWLAAEICSYQGGLPTGAPTSPVIANIVLKSADRSIALACKKKSIQYTRYADDLTFSGSDDVVAMLPFVARVLDELGYKLAEKKTNIFRRGRRQVVTGLVVNDKPNMARALRRRLRSAVHRLAAGKIAHWHGREMTEQSLRGRLAFLHMTQPAEASKLRTLLDSKKATD